MRQARGPRTTYVIQLAAAVSLGLALMAPAGTTPAPIIRLELDPAAAAPCTSEQLQQAILTRRPEAAFDATAQGADALRVSVALEAGRWVLHAEGGQSSRKLTRDLPPPGGDCEALSQTAALVVDGYLDDVQWAGTPVAIAPLPEEARPDAGVDSIVGYAELGVEGWDQAGPPGDVAQTPGFGPDLGLGARRGHLTAGLEGAIALPNQVALFAAGQPAGALRTLSSRVELHAGTGWAIPGGDALLGGGAGVLFTHASAVTVSGEVIPFFHPTSSTGASPYLGLRTGYRLSLPWRLSLELRLEARCALQATELVSEGEDPAVGTRRFSGDLALVASRTFL